MFRITTRVLCPRMLELPSPSCCSTLLPKRHADDSKNGRGSSSRVNSLKKYWFFRYVDYIKNYDKLLESKFPRSMHVYRIFSHGTREFYKDLKLYVQTIKKARTSGVDSLSREELELSFKMPKDLIKISPVLLVSAVPFTNYIIFPLAFYFPHVLLTSHYWSIQDKLKFMLKEHKRRLVHNKPLLRCMQREVCKVHETRLQAEFRDIVAHLGSGTHPKVQQILDCRQLFSGEPFSLSELTRKHVIELLKVHGLSRFGLRHRKRLLERGLLIKRMDTAIQREGGVCKLPYDAIRWALSFRGVNPVNMSIDSMQVWLDQWLSISAEVDENSISLLLHCPILLAYNLETNWTLLYHGKKKHK
ncbi:LETM1 domain-containing protein 1 [Copidosoma floridanum]|uniref:LETM1 domain-containing protein 1 n=1 Tax=Copidosoma floridanum TaxID=29053 RepID=UPI0006C9681E|nr:LETM1 domain-containing protein 1 [Copidosoma floridanum]